MHTDETPGARIWRQEQRGLLTDDDVTRMLAWTGAHRSYTAAVAGGAR